MVPLVLVIVGHVWPMRYCQDNVRLSAVRSPNNDSFDSCHGLGMDDRHTKQSAILLKALRLALADTKEHRLYKSGKLDGLFPSRLGPSGDAATSALRDGYLELVRTEIRGKVNIEWVRLTPNGVEFIYQHDSPRAVLEEMYQMMEDARHGVPAWLVNIQEQMRALSTSFGDQMQRYLQRLDSLTRRVEEALRRVEADVPVLAEPMQSIVPWGLEVLTFLDHRRLSGRSDPCPLPELFAAAHLKFRQLSLTEFQVGLKRLADNRAVKLLPYSDSAHIPEPEYAIPDGRHMLYYAAR
jgi:hypothetical protein